MSECQDWGNPWWPASSPDELARFKAWLVLEGGWRQRNELLNTFAPTEPTVDDLPGSRVDGTLLHQLAVAVMTATTEAQEGMKPSDEALRHRDALVRRAQDVASPAVAGEQERPA